LYLHREQKKKPAQDQNKPYADCACLMVKLI
jgi:hypothetical protein